MKSECRTLDRSIWLSWSYVMRMQGWGYIVIFFYLCMYVWRMDIFTLHEMYNPDTLHGLVFAVGTGGWSLPIGSCCDVQEGSPCRSLAISLWTSCGAGYSPDTTSGPVPYASRLVCLPVKYLLRGITAERSHCWLVSRDYMSFPLSSSCPSQDSKIKLLTPSWSYQLADSNYHMWCSFGRIPCLQILSFLCCTRNETKKVGWRAFDHLSTVWFVSLLTAQNFTDVFVIQWNLSGTSHSAKKTLPGKTIFLSVKFWFFEMSHLFLISILLVTSILGLQGRGATNIPTPCP